MTRSFICMLILYTFLRLVLAAWYVLVYTIAIVTPANYLLKPGARLLRTLGWRSARQRHIWGQPALALNGDVGVPAHRRALLVQEGDDLLWASRQEMAAKVKERTGVKVSPKAISRCRKRRREEGHGSEA